jgi:ATP-dependent Lhr-like helicase
VLLAERRAIEVGVAGEVRFIAADDAAKYRDALGCAIPVGLPVVFTDPVARPLEALIARYARTHGPFLAAEVARRFGAPIERVDGAITALAADERLIRGEFRPDGVQREWCDPDVLRQLRRRSLATLRREIEPVEPDAFARFLPAWHGIGAGRRGPDALVDAIGMLAGAPLVASTIERDILPARVAAYRPATLDELCTSGDVIWVGAGAIGSRDGRIRLCFADQIATLAATWERPDPPGGALHDAMREVLARRGASFWGQLREADPLASDVELLAALWDLVWAGEVTNDSLAPLRAVIAGGGAAPKRPARAASGMSRPRPGRLTRLGPPAGAGRWSLVEPLLSPAPTPTEAAHAQALQLLDRFGVVTREAVNAEGVAGGYTSVYGVLKVLEERGRARRGYFVAGLGAAQFAVPGAVDRLRNEREAGDDAPLVLAATDPAQPYGAALAWPDRPGEPGGRPARSATSVVVLRAGVPLVWFDRSARHLVTFPASADDHSWATALAGLVHSGAERSVEVRKVDGQPPDEPALAALRAAGFVDGYRGLVLRG